MTFEEIRKMIIISLFTDDELYETFVLKGGNALLVYGINKRASMDIDVSMGGNFSEEELHIIKDKLEKSLKETFKRQGHDVIDVKLNKKPRYMDKEKEKFWGGYCLEFKIVSVENKKRLDSGEITLDKLRRLSKVIDGTNNSKTFKVDISSYEYCDKKIEKEVDGFPIYVYTPIIIVYEKLRAICQQQEYTDIVDTRRTPRARDFFDIYTIIEAHGDFSNIKEDIFKEENLKDLKEIFKLKHVPLNLLGNIEKYRAFHEENFSSVKDTVYTSIDKLESYDFYFDYTRKLADKLLSLMISLDMVDSIVSNA